MPSSGFSSQPFTKNSRRASVGGLSGGGFCAVYNSDGMCATVCLNDGDAHNLPVESGEAADSSGIFVKYELRQDSGGAGKLRGGPGTWEVIYYRESMVNGGPQRSLCQPFGAVGAKPGLANAITISVPLETYPPEFVNSPRILAVARKYLAYPNAEHPNTHMTGSRFPPGFTNNVMMGGGGGYGNPFERESAKVLEDVFNGYVSVEAAKRDYGVVIDEKTWTVDEKATRALRSK